VATNPLRDWGLGLLILGGVVLVLSVGMALAEGIILSASDRGYALSRVAGPGIVAAVVLLAAGALLVRASYPRGSRSPSRAR
jgi:hypothetical protein